MIIGERIAATSYDVYSSNTLFANLSTSSTNGGGAILVNNSKLKFECVSCLFESCICTVAAYGGGIHVSTASYSNIHSVCGKFCRTSSCGQLSRAIVSSNKENINALISYVQCGLRSSPAGGESLIAMSGKYRMHDINASDDHITGDSIIAPHDTQGDAYVKYMIITKSSAKRASRIRDNSLTVSYMNIINNTISYSLFYTYGTPTCKDSVFIDNKCSTLADGVSTKFISCYFDQQMTGSITTESCRVNQAMYTTVKLRSLYKCINVRATQNYALKHVSNTVFIIILMLSSINN